MSDHEEQEQLPEDLPKVFLSYSRKDRERAQRLAEVLRARDFGVFRDTDDILPTEEWRGRLEQLIEEADTIVFLLSPHSATSEVCAWEVDYATSLNKRIAPIVIDDVDTGDIPPLLSKLNFIFATERDPFENAVDTLVSALNTDIEWIREHTRLAGLGRRWHLADRAPRLLLRGQDIADSETWRDTRPDDAPAVTGLQAAFITASRNGAVRRQRNTVLASFAALIIAVTLAGLAYWQRQVAVENEQRAARERDRAWVVQSQFMGKRASDYTSAGDHTTAMLLALSVLPDNKATAYRRDANRPYVTEAEKGLYDGYLDNRELVVSGHAEGILGTAVSPDGRYLATVSNDGNSRLWDLETGKGLPFFDRTGLKFRAVSFSNDSQRIVVGPYGEGQFRVWNIKLGREELVLTQSLRDSSIAVFDSDGGRILAASQGTIRLWDARTGAVLSVFSGHTSNISDAMFSPDESKILSWSFDDRSVRLWDVATGAQQVLYQGKGGVHVRVNQEWTRILVWEVGEETGTSLWDLESGRKVAQISDEYATDATFAPGRGPLLITFGDKTVHEHDRTTGARVRTYTQTKENIGSITYSPNGAFLYVEGIEGSQALLRRVKSSTGNDYDFVYARLPGGQSFSRNSEVIAGRFHFRSDVTGKSYQKLRAAWLTGSSRGQVLLNGNMIGPWVSSGRFSFSSDSRRLLNYHRGKVTAWDAVSGVEVPPTSEELKAVPPRNHGTVSYFRTTYNFAAGLKASKVSETIYKNGRNTGSDSDYHYKETIEIRRLGSDELVSEIALADVYDIQFNPQGTLLAVSPLKDPVVSIWDVNSGKQVHALTGHSRRVWDFAFSNDGRKIATGSDDATARVWDVETGRQLLHLERHKAAVLGVAFSGDDKRLATASWDKTGRVWDADTGRSVSVLAALDPMHVIALNADGTRAISNGNGIVLWETDTGKELASMFLRPTVAGFAVSPDWTKIFVLPYDDSTEPPRIWQMFSTTQKLVDHAKRTVSRCLTREQRKANFLSPAPPRWCITGPDLEAEKNPEKWRPRWPYRSAAWRDWLIAKDRGEDPPLPADAVTWSN